MGRLSPCAVLLFVLVLVLAFLVLVARSAGRAGGHEGRGAEVSGGAGRSERLAGRAGTHLVVDTLNLAHWRRRERGGATTEPIGLCDVIETIDATAPALRERFADRVMYVTKDRESQLNNPRVRALYQAAARRNQVYVYVVERYEPGRAPTGPRATGAHSERGRDDFYIAVLADRWRCPVLSEDRYQDLQEMKSQLGPFQVYEYAYWRLAPDRDYVAPASGAYAGLRRPRLLRYQDYL